MKALILTIIASICLFLFVVKAAYGTDSRNQTNDADEKERQKLIEKQDKDIDLDKAD